MKKHVAIYLFVIGIVLISTGSMPLLQQHNVEEEKIPEYIEIDSSKWSFADNESNIRLHLNFNQLPKGPEKLPVYQIDYPEFTSENAIEISENNNFLFDLKPVKIDNKRYSLKDEEKRVYYYYTTAILYNPIEMHFNPWDVVLEYPNSENKTNVRLSDDYIDMERAESIALNFIDDHGGIPDDAISLMPQVTNDYDPFSDLTINNSYIFKYRRQIDNEYPVVGSGESLSIRISNTGKVVSFLKSWLSSYQQEKKEVKIFNSYQALNSLNNVPISAYDVDYNITDIYLAYTNPTFHERIESLKPVWVFELEGSEELILMVDAETLEQCY